MQHRRSLCATMLLLHDGGVAAVVAAAVVCTAQPPQPLLISGSGLVACQAAMQSLHSSLCCISRLANSCCRSIDHVTVDHQVLVALCMLTVFSHSHVWFEGCLRMQVVCAFMHDFLSLCVDSQCMCVSCVEA